MVTQSPTGTAAAVRAAMAAKHLSQRDVASALNVSQTAVHRRLKGEVDFSVPQLAAVASLVGVPTSDLLGDAA